MGRNQCELSSSGPYYLYASEHMADFFNTGCAGPGPVASAPHYSAPRG
jgi:hypothetical protein